MLLESRFCRKQAQSWACVCAVQLLQCSQGPLLPCHFLLVKLCLPTMRAGRKKTQTPHNNPHTKCQFKAFQEKHLGHLHACKQKRLSQTSQSSAVSHTTPSVQGRHTRRAQAPCSSHMRTATLFHHPALDFVSLRSLPSLHIYLSSAQISTMSTRAERWSSEATSASLLALSSCCKCFSLSDNVGLSFSSKNLHPS